MIKRILILLTLVVMAVYAIAAAVLFSKKPEQEVCKGMSLAIKDSIDYGFTTEQQIKSVLKKKGLFPEGKSLKDINVRSIEKILAQQSEYRDLPANPCNSGNQRQRRQLLH